MVSKGKKKRFRPVFSPINWGRIEPAQLVENWLNRLPLPSWGYKITLVFVQNQAVSLHSHSRIQNYSRFCPKSNNEFAFLVEAWPFSIEVQSRPNRTSKRPTVNCYAFNALMTSVNPPFCLHNKCSSRCFMYFSLGL